MSKGPVAARAPVWRPGYPQQIRPVGGGCRQQLDVDCGSCAQVGLESTLILWALGLHSRSEGVPRRFLASSSCCQAPRPTMPEALRGRISEDKCHLLAQGWSCHKAGPWGGEVKESRGAQSSGCPMGVTSLPLCGPRGPGPRKQYAVWTLLAQFPAQPEMHTVWMGLPPSAQGNMSPADGPGDGQMPERATAFPLSRRVEAGRVGPRHSPVCWAHLPGRY